MELNAEDEARGHSSNLPVRLSMHENASTPLSGALAATVHLTQRRRAHEHHECSVLLARIACDRRVRLCIRCPAGREPPVRHPAEGQHRGMQRHCRQEEQDDGSAAERGAGGRHLLHAWA